MGLDRLGVKSEKELSLRRTGMALPGDLHILTETLVQRLLCRIGPFAPM
ncbi:hypothetical protein [Hydrogenophaga sp. 5NK40-0174]